MVVWLRTLLDLSLNSGLREWYPVSSSLNLLSLSSYSEGSMLSSRNRPSIYLSLKYCSTAPTSSSASNGNGTRLGFHLRLDLLLPILDKLSICESDHLSKVNDLTFEIFWFGGPRTLL